MLLRLDAGGWVGIVFSAAGLVGLAVAALLGYGLHDDRRTHAHVSGTVVANDQHCGRGGCSYRPVVEYEFGGGRYGITGGIGHPAPVFKVGEAVTVLVPPRHPVDARIDHVSETGYSIRYGLGFFALFGGIGAVRLYLWRRGFAHARWAREAGTPVQATLTGVERDTGLRLGGRSRYCIAAQWQNPRDGRIYRFLSEPMWTDPSRALAGREHLSVRLDPDRPQRYWVDTGFLLHPAG